MIAACPIQLVDADYWLLVDAVTDYAIFHLDPQGVMLSWNAGAGVLKGYSIAFTAWSLTIGLISLIEYLSCPLAARNSGHGFGRFPLLVMTKSPPQVLMVPITRC
jgi:hypothetical protein